MVASMRLAAGKAGSSPVLSPGGRQLFSLDCIGFAAVEFRSAMSQETRSLIGPQLAALYDERMLPLPLRLVELLARLCVAEAMAEYDRARAK
jgi:hypothetical protein